MPDAPGSGETESPSPEPGWFAKTLGGIGLIALSRQMAKHQVEDDIPGVTSPNPRAQKIAERATALVEEGGTDQEVIDEVTKIARGKARDLRIASTLVRQDGVWIEEPEPNRVVRILNAAAAGEPIAPPRPEQAARFAPIAEFNALDPAAAFEELKGLVPKLNEVESAYVTAFRSVGENGDNIPAIYPYWSKMLQSLRLVVGPDSGSEHIIVQSIAALNLATWQIPERGKQPSS
jgi:hypothetical protein